MCVAKIAARKLLEECRISYPVDLYYIAKKINVEIYDTVELPDSILGSTRITNTMGIRIILINATQRESRQRFTIAHEIGHIILNHSNSEYQFSDMGKPHKNEPGQERQADIFAAELLMPVKEFKDIYFNHHITDIFKIIKYFDVSYQAAEIRLKELKLL